MINTPIADEFARSLASRIPPAPTMAFVGEENAAPEWIVGVKETAEGRLLIARLTDGLMTYKIRFGWVDQQSDGTNMFTETAIGSCQIKDSAALSGGDNQ